MIASLLVLMRSFLWVKLGLVAVFVAARAYAFFRRKFHPELSVGLLLFYLLIAIMGIVWCVIGLLRVNYAQGNLDGFKLYTLWSLAFCLLYALLDDNGPTIFHRAIVLSGLLIPVINIAAIWYPDLFSDPTALMVAGNERGVWEFSSANIASLFIVAPYLLSLQLTAKTSKWAKLSLLFSLVMVALSGRRALWLVVVSTPCLILLLAKITKQSVRPKVLAFSLVIMATLGLGLMSLQNDATDRLMSAFSGDDYRDIQRPYLLKAFSEVPLLGSGFGGRAEYTRGDQAPWHYELTYEKMLFNLGIIGTCGIVLLFGIYFWRVIRVLKQHHGAVPFALLIGLVSLLIGSYSNPYLGGFDSLFFVGVLPYLSTFNERAGAS